MTRVYIVAGNRSEADNYIRMRSVTANRNLYYYVAGPDYLRGIVNPHGVFIGSWQYRKDIGDIIYQMIISSSTPNPMLEKLYRELPVRPQAKTAMQVMQEAQDIAAKKIAEEMDRELLHSMMSYKPVNQPMSVKDFFDSIK